MGRTGFSSSIIRTPLVSKVKAETRDMTAASGSVSYTGYGFKPSCIIFFSCISFGVLASWGIVDMIKTAMVISHDYANVYVGETNPVIEIAESGTQMQIGYLTAFDADGFTLSWTKLGTPSANSISVFVLALR